MSLNRIEQALFDYIGSHPEERQHFQDKVRAIVAASEDAPQAAARIASELRRYSDERSGVAPGFLGPSHPPGPHKTSMRNLAEYLVRLWTEPKPKKRSPEGTGDAPPGGFLGE
jgi:hypothetical protein